MARAQIPLDVIYYIIDLLVLDTPPLSYEYSPAVQSTLVALCLTSRGVNHFARGFLYSKLCLPSTNALELLMSNGRGSKRNLVLAKSLYVNIDALQTTYKRGYYKHVSAHLLTLLRTVSPSLNRLALSCSFWRAPERRQGLEHERHFWSSIHSILPSVLSNLTELVVVNCSLFLNCLPAAFHTISPKITRIALTSSEDTRLFARREAWSLMPNLETLRLTCQDDTIGDVERIINHLPDWCELVALYQSSRFISVGHLVNNLSGRLRRAQNRPKPVKVTVKTETLATPLLAAGYF